MANGRYAEKFGIDTSDEAWKSMSLEEQVNAISLPKETVDALSTSELTEWALEYPFLCDILLFNSAQDAMDYYSRTSYLFKTLFTREDVDREFLGALKDLEVDYNSLIDRNSDVEYPLHESGYIKELFLECYFSTRMADLPKDEKEELLNTLIARSIDKKEIYENYAISRMYFDVPTWSNVSETAGIQATNSEGFTNSGIIISYYGVQYYVGSYSKYGVSAGCMKYYSGDMSAAEAQVYDNDIMSVHPSWVKLSGATFKYNCFSYAWILTSTSNEYWLTTPMAFTYSSEITYVGSGCSANTNDIINIYKPDGTLNHAVIVTSGSNSPTTTATISKCGAGGVYSASLQDMLFAFGGDYEVYRK